MENVTRDAEEKGQWEEINHEANAQQRESGTGTTGHSPLSRPPQLVVVEDAPASSPSSSSFLSSLFLTPFNFLTGRTPSSSSTPAPVPSPSPRSVSPARSSRNMQRSEELQAQDNEIKALREQLAEKEANTEIKALREQLAEKEAKREQQLEVERQQEANRKLEKAQRRALEKAQRRAAKEEQRAMERRQQQEAAISAPPGYSPPTPPLRPRSATLSPSNNNGEGSQRNGLASDQQVNFHLSPIALVPSRSAPASTHSPIPSVSAVSESNAQPAQSLPDSPVEQKLAADVVASGAPAEWEPEQTSDEPILEEGTTVETARHSPTGSASQLPVVEQKLAQEGVSIHLPSATGSEETGGPTAEEPCEESAIEAAVHSSTGDAEQKILEEGAAQQQMQHTTLLVTLQQQEAIRRQLAEQQELKAAAEEAARQAAEQERIRQEAAQQEAARQAAEQERIRQEAVEQERIRQEAVEQERIRQEAAEARLTALRLQQEQEAQRVILLQQQAAVRQLQEDQERQRAAEAQAAEERRRAEDAFAASCATGARTLAEHNKIVDAAVLRAGF